MKPRHRILIVEDESAIAELIAVNLRHGGLTPICVSDGAAAQREIDAAVPDLILLDWMLPGESGMVLARKWRGNARLKEVPILMLTARGDESDRVAGLDSGADDYIVKPFSTQELLARVRAALRRRTPQAEDVTVTLGALALDPQTHRASWQGAPLKLGPTEFKLLHHLMRQAERVHSRSQLLDQVWGDQVYIEERTVDVHIKRLREALGTASVMLETVRGVGYRLTVHAAGAAPPEAGAALGGSQLAQP